MSNPGVSLCDDEVKYVNKKSERVVVVKSARKKRKGVKPRADARAQRVMQHFMLLWEKLS
jgi:hypothetical protein